MIGNVKEHKVKVITFVFYNDGYLDALEFCVNNGYTIETIIPLVDPRSKQLTGQSELTGKKELK